MPTRPLKKAKKDASNGPLHGVNVFVENLNDDGSDAGTTIISETAMSLGATVSSSLGEGITHYICSNGSTARLAASIVLSIKVVGPSWIEKCKKESKKVDESGHAVISGITASDAAAAVLSIPNACGSSAREYHQSSSSRTGWNGSFYSTDSTRKTRGDERNDAEQQEHNRSGASAAAASSSTKNGFNFLSSSPATAFARNMLLSSSFNDHFPVEGTDNLSDSDGHCQTQPNSANKSSHYSISKNSINKNSNSRSSSSSKDCQFIPLPSYKEYSSGVLPTALKMRRRSERICDNVEQTGDEMMSMEETLEDILSINPDEPMPIVREGDDEWPSEEEISAQLEVSKEAGRRMGMEVRRTYVDKKNVTPDREKENLRDLDMKKKPQKEGEKVERKDKPSPSNSIKGSDTKHKVENRDNKWTHGNMVIAVSRWAEAESDGEEGSQGEGIGVDSSLTTVQSLQKSLVALITLINEGISLSSSSGSSSGRKDKKSSTRRRSPPPVPMYQVLLLDGEEDEEDPFGAECTHLVCTLPPPPTSLPHHCFSLRVLLALARGVPIVSNAWIEECCSQQTWIDHAPYEYELSKIRRVRGKARAVFKGTTFFLGTCTNPEPKFLLAFISALGGSVTDNLSQAEFMIQGNTNDGLDWRDNATKSINQNIGRAKTKRVGESRGPLKAEMLALAFTMARKSAVVTWKYICDCLEYGSRLKPTGRFGHLVTFNEPREQAIVSSSSSSSSSGGAMRKGMSTYSRPAKSQPSQTTVSVPVAAYSPSASEKGRAGRPRKCSTPIIEYDSNCNHDCNGSTDLNGNGASREIKNGQLLYSASQNIPTYTARSGIANGRRNIDNERKRKRNRESDNDKSEVATIKRRDRKVDDDNDDGSDVRNSDVSSDDGENTLCAPAVPAVGRVGSWAEL